MSNIVEFALRMKDMASQSLRQFGTSASQTFTRASQLTTNLSINNRVLGQSYEQLQLRIREVERTIRNSTIPSEIRSARRELELLQRQSNSHIGNTGRFSTGSSSGNSGLMGMVGMAGLAGMATAAVAGVAYKGINFIGESISKGLERQQIQTSFNVLAGSEQKGSSLTNQLVALQRDTILGSEVFKNAQIMMGFGFKPDEVYKNLKMLGDVSMGDADKLQALTLAFSQSKAAGKLMGQDLLQYINAGFNPLQVISEKTGKSIGQLKEDMEKGKIPFSMIEQAFKDATSEGGRFNNMLAKIAETPAGKVQQLSGQWAELKVQVGATFMPLLSMGLDFASKMMPVIENLINPLAAGIQKAVSWLKSASDTTGGWMDYLTIVKDLISNNIVPYVQTMWGYISKVVVKLGEFISKSELIKDVFRLVKTFVGYIYDAITWYIDKLSWLFDNVVMPVLNSIEKAYQWIKGIDSRFDRLKEGAGVNPNAPIVPAALSNNAFAQGQWKTQWTANNPASMAKNMPLPMTPDKVQQQNSQLLGQIATNTKTNADNSTANEKSITSGGPKIINISVGKFLDSINIHANTITESTNEMEQKILEMFSRVLAQGATMAQ